MTSAINTSNAPSNSTSVLPSVGTSVLGTTADTFLFASIQADTARRLADGSFNSHIRFEPFLFANYKAPKNRNIEAFKREMRRVIQHHWDVVPQYRRSEKIDLETVSYFSQSVTTLVADIEQMLRLFAPIRLSALPLQGIASTTAPEPKAAPAASAASAASTAQAKGKQAAKPAAKPKSTQATAPAVNKNMPKFTDLITRFQAYEKEAAEDSAPFVVAPEGMNEEEFLAQIATEIWTYLLGLIREIFGNYTQAIILFIEWKFRPKTVRVAIDWRVRPPVGEEFIKFLKAHEPRTPGPRDKRGGDRRIEYRSHEDPPRRDFHADGDRFDRRDRGDRFDRGDRSSDRGDRFERGGRDDRSGKFSPRPHHDRDRHHDRHNDRDMDRNEDRNRDFKQNNHNSDHKHDKFNKHDRHDKQVKHDSGRAEHHDKGGHGHHRDRDNRRGPHTKFATHDHDAAKESPEALENAIAAAHAAIEQLKSNSKLHEVPLAPVNSYLRRAQHTLIIDEGFDTESRGEGKNRCVFVKRK